MPKNCSTEVVISISIALTHLASCSDSREDDFNFFSHETKPALASRIKNWFFFPSPRFQPIKINLNLMTLVYDERLKTPGIGEVFFFFPAYKAI